VYKDHIDNRSISRIRRLESHEREFEIAKMIGGDNPSDVSIKNAQELLNL
jgi:DNA repair protein RecN (Recombination protein N)